jgi:hypothetical protein
MLVLEHSVGSISSTRLLRLSLGLCSGVSRAFGLRRAMSPGHASRRFPEFPHVDIIAIGACVGSGDGECRRARGG